MGSVTVQIVATNTPVGDAVPVEAGEDRSDRQHPSAGLSRDAEVHPVNEQGAPVPLFLKSVLGAASC